MELGQRIRQARLEAGLSQRQLCGQRLTRNMLSLIENGSARPSMDTLQYFAQRLEKPIGWFLGEQTVDPQQAAVDRARQCWRAGDAQGVLTALEKYKGDARLDGEAGLLGYLARLGLAGQALEAGRLPYARHLLHQAAAQESPYITPALLQERQVLLARAGEPAAPNCDQVLLARALLAVDTDPKRCMEILQAAEDRNAARWLFLAGQARLNLRQYQEAEACLLAVEGVYPEAVPMLETCYRELGDYRKAYEYACKGRK